MLASIYTSIFLTNTVFGPCQDNDNPCMNGGSCSLINGSKTCVCPPDYTGIFCNQCELHRPCHLEGAWGSWDFACIYSYNLFIYLFIYFTLNFSVTSNLTISPTLVIGNEGEGVTIDCSPLVETSLPTLSRQAPNEDAFMVIDPSDSRLTAVDVEEENLRRFTYSGLLRSENGSRFQCLFGMEISNTNLLLVYCEWWKSVGIRKQCVLHAIIYH